MEFMVCIHQVMKVAAVKFPEVSIVLPTFNRQAVVEQAITSALTLQEEALELIVVDDGSTDETLRIVGKITDPRLSIVRVGRNGGAGAARNVGISVARAPYVAFLDSDDIYLPGRLTQPLTILRRRPAVGVALSTFTTSKGCKQTAHYMPQRVYAGEDLERLVARHVLQPSTSGLTLRRDLLLAIGGFDTSLLWMEDRDLAMRAARRADGATIDQPLWHKRWQADGISSNRNTYFPSLLVFLAMHPIYAEQELEFRNYLIARHLVKMGFHSGPLAAMKDYSVARGRLFPALPPLPSLLMRYFKTHRSRGAQQQALLAREDKLVHSLGTASILSLVATMAAEACQNF